MRTTSQKTNSIEFSILPHNDINIMNLLLKGITYYENGQVNISVQIFHLQKSLKFICFHIK